MTIQLNYRGQLAMAAMRPSEEIDPRPGTKISDIIRAAAARNGHEFAKLVLASDGSFRNTLLIALDGEQVQNPDQAVLPASAREITLLPPIAGG